MRAAGQVRAYRRVPGLESPWKAGGHWRAEVGKTFKEAASQMRMFRWGLEPVQS